MARVGPQRHKKKIEFSALLNGLFWKTV